MHVQKASTLFKLEPFLIHFSYFTKDATAMDCLRLFGIGFIGFLLTFLATMLRRRHRCFRYRILSISAICIDLPCSNMQTEVARQRQGIQSIEQFSISWPVCSSSEFASLSVSFCVGASSLATFLGCSRLRTKRCWQQRSKIQNIHSRHIHFSNTCCIMLHPADWCFICFIKIPMNFGTQQLFHSSKHSGDYRLGWSSIEERSLICTDVTASELNLLKIQHGVKQNKLKQEYVKSLCQAV